MGKWLILLIVLGIASNNGIYIPDWAWFATAIIVAIGATVVMIEATQEDK